MKKVLIAALALCLFATLSFADTISNPTGGTETANQGTAGVTPWPVVDSSAVPSCGATPATCNVIGRVQELDALSLSAASVTTATVVAIGGAAFIDTTGYSSISVQFTSIGASNIVIFEGSEDNSNWVGRGLYNINNFFGTGSSQQTFGVTGSTLTSNGFMYQGSVVSRYFRVRVTSAGTGTVTALATLRKAPFTVPPSAAQGPTVTGAAISSTAGNMVAMGHARTSNNVVTNGQANDVPATLAGVLIDKPYSIPELDWQYAAASGGILNTTTAVTMVASAGASTRNYVTGCQLSSEALTNATEVAIRDGAGGTVLWRTKIGTAGLTSGRDFTFPTPLKGTAATLMEAVTITASGAGAVYINCQGYQAP